MTFAKARSGSDRGATLIEFAILAPLLFLFLFGIIEFGWLFARNVNVSHGAREGARLAIVDFGNANAIVAETCDRMTLATMGNPSAVDVTLGRADATGNGSANDVGDYAIVTVTAPGTSLTGLFNWALPPTLQLTSTAEILIEQSPSWSTGTFACP
ncbi:MAG TPA: TadE/TadG family type IV pilus assembly protein [Acidimicrobiia bacterium]|nr:TadE/TadG family type IV pilus assembly protein [Acidimicrobiia bacterium]